ncbi:MAG: ATP-binding protein [Castellaniella sp.]|uniref:ATP-binding protein n=1 Tax=Castellaniella sp. TaxID=1955812 RepID=UPI003C744ECB
MNSLRWPWVRRRPDGPPDATPARSDWSLRQRLLLAVMGTSVGLWLTSLAIVVGVAWFATSEVFDDALEEGSRLVLQIGLPGEAAGGIQDPRAQRSDTLKLRMYYQLVAPDGRVFLRGEDTPKTAFLPDARRKTMATVRVEGAFWRVHVRPGPGGVTVQVAQPMEERLDLLEELAENLAWPALGLLAMLGLLSWFLIRRLLRPLEDTAMLIDVKSPHDLTPVQTPNPPRELQPILDALNALLARLSTALDSERRFTSDAAHELRTPLAALRMRVQLIERELQLPDAHLRQLRADLDRCTALVESLLALARLEPQAEPLVREDVVLDALLDNLNMEASAPGIRMERALAVPKLHAAPTLLASALRNLIDNAVRYGREGGRVRIESSRLPPGGTRLAVRDDGAGVPPDQRARLGERFFRVLGTEQTGNGLGLSIVARIAALHGATLRFEDGLEGQGLGVVVDFPPD